MLSLGARQQNLMAHPNGGQWVGFGLGDNIFHEIIVDLDDCGEHFEGRFFAFAEDKAYPNITGKIITKNKGNSHEVVVDIHAFDHRGPVPPDSAVYREMWPDTKFSPAAALKIKFIKNILQVSWSSQDELTGTCELTIIPKGKKSKYVPEKGVNSWDSYKEYISKTKVDGFVFRGQSKPWSLRTSFHRTNRKDLVQYQQIDIPFIKSRTINELSQFTNKPYDEQYWAFLYLLQHHGFPTPLLDWTYSPYIAAFFAFKNAKNKDKVRIVSFDKRSWHSDFSRAKILAYSSANLTFVDPLPVGNNRAIPQQSLISVTNLADIEDYVEFREGKANKTYMRVFDIPSSERETALNDLRLMGITEASLFPGLDGICGELKSQFFGE